MKLGKATLLAAACLGLLGLASGARADTITFAFSQTSGPSPFIFTPTMASASLTTAAGVVGTVTVTDINTSVAITETGVVLDLDGTTATAADTEFGFDVQPIDSGSLTLTIPGPLAINVLTVNFTGALMGFNNSGILSLDASNTNGTITKMTSDIATLGDPEDMDFAFSDVSPSVGEGKVGGGTLFLNSFTAQAGVVTVQAAGEIGSPVPLPSAAWMGLGTLGAMGLLGLVRRRRGAFA